MKQQGANWTSNMVGLAAALLFMLLLVLTLRVLLVPFVGAMFLAYLFEPGIEALQRRGMQRGKAYLVVFAVATAAVIVLMSLAPSWLHTESASGSTETLYERLHAQLDRLEVWTNSRFPMLKSLDISGEISTRAAELAQDLLVELPSLITSFVVNLVLVPVIAYFIVRDGRNLRRRIVSIVPNRYFEMVLIMFHRIDEQIGGYLRGRLIECMLVAVTQMLLMGVAATATSIPQPQILLVAAVCGITNLIPYAGPVLGSAFGVFLYFSENLPLNSILVFLIIVAVVHVIDNVLIAPAVMSHNVNLHPLTVALVLVIGGETMGILGLLIAIPVASSIKVVGQEFYANYQAQVR